MRFQIAGAALLGLAMVMTSLSGAPSQAQTVTGGTGAAPKALQYDWFAKRTSAVKAKPVRRVALARYLGTGTYICSPAGSGRNSHCFKR